MFEQSMRREPRGIGGWLLLFVFGQVATVLMNLSMVGDALAGLAPDAWALGKTFVIYRPLAIMEVGYALLMVIGPAAGLVMIFVRSERTPSFWQVFYVVVATLALIDIVGGQIFSSQFVPTLAPENGGEVEKQFAAASLQNARVVLVAIVWGLYWGRSLRVKHTFTKEAEQQSEAGLMQEAG